MTSSHMTPTTQHAELAKALLNTFKGRRSAYAVRRGKSYFPDRDGSKDRTLSEVVVEKHLSGTQPIGIYLVDAGADTCSFGVFDIDDHDGNAGWDLVRESARRIAAKLDANAMRYIAFRSGGGKGIHIALPFISPIKVADLRRFMIQILRSEGLQDGAKGVEGKEVEVFPKQNSVKPGEYGNLVALPLARESVLLDKNFNPTDADPRAVLEAFVHNDTTSVNKAPRAKQTPPSPSGRNALSDCLFIKHCAEAAKNLSEPLWYAAACNLAPTPGGEEFFQELSALDGARYDDAKTAAKFKHAVQGNAAHTCAKIAELGFTCPNMKPDGQCSVTGGRHPLSFAKNDKELITDLRRVTPVHVRHRKIAALVIDRLRLAGTFYVAKDDNSLLYFYNPEKRLYSIDSDDFKALCCDLFGMNAAEAEYKFALEEIKTYTTRSGTRADFFRFSRYSDGVLYINAGKHQVFRLNGTEIETVDNGTDGILFRNAAEVEPVLPAKSYRGSPVRRHLVAALNCSDQHMLDLFEVYIYAIFFESLLPTKPIVLITGEKGSGKSYTGRALKRALFGGEANVDTGLTADERNATAALANNYLLCMDNVDGQIKWLANLLASVATGNQIRERKLYVNNVEVAFTPRCFVIINSRDPASVKRDDVADRLLIFKVDRFKQFAPESDLLGKIALHRPEIWREMLTKLNLIVSRLRNGIPSQKTDQRLADFANLGLLIAEIVDASGAREAFAKLEEERNSLTLAPAVSTCSGERGTRPSGRSLGRRYLRRAKGVCSPVAPVSASQYPPGSRPALLSPPAPCGKPAGAS